MNTLTKVRRIHGSCHCGNIRITVDWPDAKPTIPVRACGCTMCRKHGAVWTSNPEGAFDLHINNDAKVTRYQFGSKTADFLTCTNCGALPIVICTIEGTEYAVVNANTFDDIDPTQLIAAPADFEGETTENRLARRKRNWTPRLATQYRNEGA
jgi:hypothetical protein